MIRSFYLFLPAIIYGVFATPASAQTKPAAVRHVNVYLVKGRFGGWPANYGIWSWGDEILVGFSRGYYKDLGDRHHIATSLARATPVAPPRVAIAKKT